MKRSNDAIVGLTVLASRPSRPSAVMWVKQADVGERRHEVVAHFRDVGNARVGNAVVIRGVVGGRIQAIELAPNGWVNVRMTLDPSVNLPSEPVVLLNESSLFGDWQATVVERGALPHDDALRREVADASKRLIHPRHVAARHRKAHRGRRADRRRRRERRGPHRDRVRRPGGPELRTSIRNVADSRRLARPCTVARVGPGHAVEPTAFRRNDARSKGRERRSHRAPARLGRDVAGGPPAGRQFQRRVHELRQTAAQVRDLSARLARTRARWTRFWLRAIRCFARSIAATAPWVCSSTIRR